MVQTRVFNQTTATTTDSPQHYNNSFHHTQGRRFNKPRGLMSRSFATTSKTSQLLSLSTVLSNMFKFSTPESALPGLVLDSQGRQVTHNNRQPTPVGNTRFTKHENRQTHTFKLSQPASKTLTSCMTLSRFIAIFIVYTESLGIHRACTSINQSINQTLIIQQHHQ